VTVAQQQRPAVPWFQVTPNYPTNPASLHRCSVVTDEHAGHPRASHIGIQFKSACFLHNGDETETIVLPCG